MEMLWTDLKIGDKVKFTEEYIDRLFYLEEYRDKELFVQKIEPMMGYQKLTVICNGLHIKNHYSIRKDGRGVDSGILVFKIVELIKD